MGKFWIGGIQWKKRLSATSRSGIQSKRKNQRKDEIIPKKTKISFGKEEITKKRKIQ